MTDPRAAWGVEVAPSAGAPVGNANRAHRTTEGTFKVGDAKIEQTEGCDATETKPNTADYSRARLARDADPAKSRLDADPRAALEAVPW